MIEFKNGNIRLSEDEYDNYIELNNEDFLLSYLNPNIPSNKGASSNLFILQDPSGETEDRVIKICKTPYYRNQKNSKIARFKREIKAFQLVKKSGINGVIKFYDSGIIHIDGYDFMYLLLEKADNDLANYLEENSFAFTSNQKLNFCINIMQNFKQLHNLGIYHRDIKHDNVLVINKELKIADLGLVSFQNKDFSIDKINEKIGPIGWLSPEATNKMLTEGKKIGNVFDCEIDHQSDIFQLGKLFWYIFQGNLPTGQIQILDNKFEDEDIFNVIFSMIQYNKERRPSIIDIEQLFAPIKARLVV